MDNSYLIHALETHARIIARCTLAQKRIAAMTAENMQRAAVGSSMAYSDDMFDDIDMPSEDDVIKAFRY